MLGLVAFLTFLSKEKKILFYLGLGKFEKSISPLAKTETRCAATTVFASGIFHSRLHDNSKHLCMLSVNPKDEMDVPTAKYLIS